MKVNLLVFLFLIFLTVPMAMAENTEEEHRGSKMWIYLNGGDASFFDKSDVSDIEDAGSVTDICGNTYPVVKIGNQYWMAENMKCNKYDNQSEAYNASWLTNNTIQTSESKTYTPYYTDATDKSKWNDDSKSKYGINLTDAQVAKLGYLYSWAAVVGVADGQKWSTSFTGNRQGICPNRWHVPTNAEWQTLQDYIEITQGKGSNTAGEHLKTALGWYNDGNGTDNYGFAALSAGYSYGNSISYVGVYSGFWTVSPYKSSSSYACSRNIYYSSDYIGSSDYNKNSGQNVRCLKDLSTLATETKDDAMPFVYKQLIDGRIVIVKGDMKFDLQGVELLKNIVD